MNENKPHKGRITDVKEVSHGSGAPGLGYFLLCTFVDHPVFAGKQGHTSYVFKDESAAPRHRNDGYEVETLNSRYTVVPREVIDREHAEKANAKLRSHNANMRLKSDF